MTNVLTRLTQRPPATEAGKPAVRRVATVVWLGIALVLPFCALIVPGALPGPVDVLINLDSSAEPPPFLSQVARVAAIIDGEPARRDAGRARFKAYRHMGLSPETHNLHAS